MAKKMTRLLVFGAAAGVAAAGAYYLLKKSDENRFDEDDFDDFDDFEVDDDDDDDEYENGTESAERNYVPLNLNMPKAEDEDSLDELDDEPAPSPKTVESESPEKETIEEFFDEENEETDDDFTLADE